MSSLSDATATRRELIEHIDTTLVMDELQVDEEERGVLAEQVADSLIDHDWVVDRPESTPADQAVEFRLTERTITFDLDTGDVVNGAGRAATGPVWDRIGAYGLAGVTPEMLSEWYGAWLDGKPIVHPYDAAPRLGVFNTADEFDSTRLATGSVVRDRDGDYWMLCGDGWKSTVSNVSFAYGPRDYLPVAVVYRP